MRVRPLLILALLILAFAVGFPGPPAQGIIIRHDREDRDYVELAKAHPQVVHMNTQKPGAPPDGEGTLIGPQWVMTAAHVATLIKPGHRVRVGSQRMKVAAVHLHPDWEDGPHDIALVRIASPVRGIRPAELYRWRDEQGKSITVVGAGDTGTGRTGPTGNDGHTRGATDRIDEATEYWLKFRFDEGREATELEGISGPGDSGGPAFLEREGVRYLAGVGSGQSTRATNGREGVYGVTEYYTRVSSYLEWIAAVMSTS